LWHATLRPACVGWRSAVPHGLVRWRTKMFKIFNMNYASYASSRSLSISSLRSISWATCTTLSMLYLKRLGMRPHATSWFYAKPLTSPQPLSFIHFHLIKRSLLKVQKSTVSNWTLAFNKGPALQVYYKTIEFLILITSA